KTLEKGRQELLRLKDVWDKARLEATVYEKRSVRMYKEWAKSAKSLREKARIQKEKAALEFQLAIERRKLAGSEWQAAQFRVQAAEFQLKSLEQEANTRAIKEKIKQMEGK